MVSRLLYYEPRAKLTTNKQYTHRGQYALGINEEELNSGHEWWTRHVLRSGTSINPKGEVPHRIENYGYVVTDAGKRIGPYR
jgi:hypothetical protein